jgi:cellulose synthase/poly-beta-1,6-N-acetylglucosamine synthase-like glycosyltransferase
MIIALQILFWLSLAGLIHSYFAYPRLLQWLARGRKNNQIVHGPDTASEAWPKVIGIMAAHNEESVIAATLTSIFATDYPDDKLEVIIAADNCSDRTVEIVRDFQTRHPNLTLRELPGRNGKIRAINLSLEENRERLGLDADTVLILCDANVRWSFQLPREMAKHFRNPRVGLVASNVLDSRREHHGIADQEEAYINRENTIKYHEGVLWGRMMGAFGACFAMRGSLFQPVPENFRSDDFTHTLRCFESGLDAIVEPAAVAYEDVSEDIQVEFGRKKRISLGNFQNLRYFQRFLLPWNAGLATWFAFWSHKGLRWFGPFLIAATFISSAILTPHHWLYALACAGHLGLFLAAIADSAMARKGGHLRPLRYARYFLLMNLALAIGAWRFVAGEKTSHWEPARRVTGSQPQTSLAESAERLS